MTEQLIISLPAGMTRKMVFDTIASTNNYEPVIVSWSPGTMIVTGEDATILAVNNVKAEGNRVDRVTDNHDSENTYTISYSICTETEQSIEEFGLAKFSEEFRGWLNKKIMDVRKAELQAQVTDMVSSGKIQ